MRRIAPILFSTALLAGAMLCVPAARASVYLTNARGAHAPCVGVGPIGGPAAEYCGREFEKAGFLKDSAIGQSALALGTSDTDDGVVLRVEPMSAGAVAGFLAGEVIIAIDGQAIARGASETAEEATFGARDEPLHLRVSRAGSELNITLARGARVVPE